MKKILLSTVLLAGLAQAADQAMIILDASGSMWGRVDGKEKIVIAKEALKKVVNQWNPNTQLGLMAYGHRQKGDCNDIEVLVPVSGFDKQALLQQVKGISPKGKTPISRSLQKAADTLRYTEDKATVILISDGKETCDADPCATAKALEKQGIDFVAHVIGFNVDKETDAQLSCVAKATGGQYFSTKNTQALNKAMQTVVKTVQKAPPKQPEPQSKLLISASETEGGKHIKALHQVYQTINGKKEFVTSCLSYSHAICSRSIAPGNYELISSYNEYEVATPFSVTAGKNTKLNVVMGQTGKVKIIAVENEGGKRIRVNHNIYHVTGEGEKKRAAISVFYEEDKSYVEKLPIGNYELVSTYNRFEVVTPFTVGADTVTELTVVMGQTGKVEITAFETEGGKQVEASHSIYQPIDEDDKKHIGSCNSYKEKACKERLPVGEYLLVSTYNQFEIKTPFTVTAGQTTNLNVIMGQTSKVEITAFETEGGKQVEASHSIYQPIDEDENKFIDSCSSYKTEPCKERLPVGEYLLVSTYNQFEIKTPFTVTAGQATNLNVIMGQTGKVEITAFETEGGKQVEASHSIYQPIDEDENKFIDSCSSYKTESCKERLPVGEYILVSTYNQFEIKTPFTVTAGQTTNLNVIMGQTGKVEIIAFETEGGKQVEASHSIYQPIDEDENKFIDSCSSYKTEACKERIPVGKYFVKSRYGDIELETPLTITAGQTTQLTINFSRQNKPVDKQALIDADSQQAKTRQDATPKLSPQSSGQSSTNQSVNTQKVSSNNDMGKGDIGKTAAVIGGLVKAFGGAEKSKSPTPVAQEAQAQKQAESQAAESDNGGGDMAKAAAVMGLIQAFGDKEDVKTTKQALQAISGLNDNLSGGVLNIYKQAVTTGLPFMQAALSCYQGSDSLAQAQACDHLAKQAADAVAKKMENTVGLKPDVKYPSPHNQWNAEIKQKTVTKLQADIKEAELSITCIDNGATILDLKTCLKNGGKVGAKPKVSEEKKALQQMGNLLKMLEE